jgi:hypothetical protein
MFAEPARYVAPKRKADEHTGEDGAPRVVLIGEREDESAEAWERRVDGEREGEPR